MKRHLLVSCLLVVSLTFLGSELSAEHKKNKSALITQKRGSVGEFSLGQPIDKYSAYVVAQQGSRDYLSHDKLFRFKTDAEGNVTEITTQGWGFVTDRFIRIKYSTVRNVLRAYGKPKDVNLKEQQLILEYPGITFTFEPLKSSSTREEMLSQLLKSHVASVTLRKMPEDPPR